MTLPTNLFIDSPEVEDPSMTSLSNDSGGWVEEIVTKLKERVPAVATSSLAVKFMHKDDELGAATGSVTLINGPKTAVVPVIVRDFMLYPLDVFMFEGKVLPFNTQFFAEAFQQAGQEAFSGLAEYPMQDSVSRYMRGENLQSAIFPPNWGRYAYASANGLMDDDHFKAHYPILADVSKGADGQAFFKKVAASDRVVAHYYNNGSLPLLKKLASQTPVNLGEFSQSADKLVHRDIHVLKKDGPNRYNILSNSSCAFNPAFTTMDRLDVLGFVGKISDDVTSTMHDVDQNGEKVISFVDEHTDQVYLTQPMTGEIVAADTFGNYNVRSKTGVNIEGVVIPRVIDFDQSPVAAKIFIGKTNSTIQGSIYGTRMEHSDWTFKSCTPSPGQTGTFVFRDGNKAALALIPVTIRLVMTHLGGVILKATDLAGRALSLRVSSDCHGLQRLADCGLNEKGEHEYMLPSKLEWVAMSGFEDVSNSPEDYAVKTAAHTTSTNPITLIHTGYNQYTMRGVDKYASAAGWHNSGLESSQAKFLLASLGIGETNINQAVKVAQETGKATLHFARHVPLDGEHQSLFVAERMAKLATRLNALADSLRCDLIKEASYIENAQTVDAMLSLNFVSPDTISKFISRIPIFKAAVSHLCSCLLASRLGLREVPEAAASGAVGKLNEVVAGLEALRATQTIGKK